MLVWASAFFFEGLALGTRRWCRKGNPQECIWHQTGSYAAQSIQQRHPAFLLVEGAFWGWLAYHIFAEPRRKGLS